MKKMYLKKYWKFLIMHIGHTHKPVLSWIEYTTTLGSKGKMRQSKNFYNFIHCLIENVHLWQEAAIVSI